MIAGSGRGAGKTAVGCALMAAMPEFRWAAAKVTSHMHDLPDGLLAETNRNSDKDTGRYLAAGAERSFLVEASESPSSDKNSDRMLWQFEAWRRSAGTDALLVESGRIKPAITKRIGDPVVCLVVLGAGSDWKDSVWGRIALADAVVLPGGLSSERLPHAVQQKPTFCLPKGEWSSPELVQFVRARLLLANS